VPGVFTSFAPRALVNSSRPRRYSGVFVRPLKFTVIRRSSLGGLHVRIASRLMRAIVAFALSVLVVVAATPVVLLPLRIWLMSAKSRSVAACGSVDELFFLLMMAMITFYGVLFLFVVCWLTSVVY